MHETCHCAEHSSHPQAKTFQSIAVPGLVGLPPEKSGLHHTHSSHSGGFAKGLDTKLGLIIKVPGEYTNWPSLICFYQGIHNSFVWSSSKGWLSHAKKNQMYCSSISLMNSTTLCLFQ